MPVKTNLENDATFHLFLTKSFHSAIMIGAIFAATLISVSAQFGYDQNSANSGYRGDGGFGLQYAPTTTQEGIPFLSRHFCRHFSDVN